MTGCTSQNSHSPILLNNEILEVVESAFHLGNPLGMSTENNTVKESIGDMNSRLNVSLAIFGKADSSVKYKLFKSFCTAFYGSQLWDYSLKVVDAVWTSWRKAVRRIFRLPYRAHCYILPRVCGDAPLEKQLHARFINFFHGALTSRNTCVNICARLAINGSKSPACNSVNLICHKYAILKYDLDHCGCQGVINNILNSEQYSEAEEASAGAIKEFVQWRDDFNTPMHTKSDLQDIIDYLCTV